MKVALRASLEGPGQWSFEGLAKPTVTEIAANTLIYRDTRRKAQRFGEEMTSHQRRATMHEILGFAWHGDIRVTEMHFARLEEEAEVAMDSNSCRCRGVSGRCPGGKKMEFRVISAGLLYRAGIRRRARHYWGIKKKSYGFAVRHDQRMLADQGLYPNDED